MDKKPNIKRTLRMLNHTLRHCHNLFNKVGGEEQTWLTEINQGAKEAIRILESVQEREKAIGELYDLLDETCKDFRETTGQDEVCGLCHYEGCAHKGEEDWCGYCPGFDSDECFVMKNEIRKLAGKELLPDVSGEWGEEDV